MILRTKSVQVLLKNEALKHTSINKKMKKPLLILTALLLATSTLLTSCDTEDPAPTITVQDFVVSIDENPTVGQSIGTINATIEHANNWRYSFDPEHTGIAEYVEINSTTGEITITNPDYFDYEQVTSVSGTGKIIAFNSSDVETVASFTITIHINDIYEAPPLTIQERLDGGESPIEIYRSDNATLESLYGKTYAGGLIFYLDIATGKGYAAAPNDQSTALVWDHNSTGLEATGATSTNFGDGEVNTFTITTTLGTGNYAAQICSDLVLADYSGWFLPTLDELEEMYDVLHAKGLGNFQAAKYWSSSELDVNGAWYRDFAVSSGQTGGTATKVNAYAVRAFRAF